MSVFVKQTPCFYTMKVTSQKIFFFLLFSLFSINLFAQTGNYVSLKQHSEILENKKKIISEIDLYFDKNKQTITKFYHSNPEFIMTVNAYGEIKSYYPHKNEVDYKQVSELSSKRNLIYYFANNFTDHLGLADDGFQLVSSSTENQYYITQWQAPSVLKGIESVKMVFEKGIPVYSEYKANKKKIIKKTYYTNYQDFSQFRLPMKIIEISYLPSGDSVINRTSFSNVKISSTADEKYFNFKIPENAKYLGSNKNK